MSDKDQNPLEPELEPPASQRTTTRRERRPAVPSEQQTYVAPVPVPPNDDDAKRTREIRRVAVSPAVDPRRRETVRRVMPPSDEARPPSDPPPVVEETAPLGTNTRAILEANPAARMTVRLTPGALAASPSPVLEEIEPKVAPSPHGGPRGTVRLEPRKRGGTRMLVAGVADATRDAESRWAGGAWDEGDDAIDRSALPSSTRPAVTPAHVLQLGAARAHNFNAPLIAIVGFGLMLAAGLLIFAVRGGERPAVTDVDPPATPAAVTVAPNAFEAAPPTSVATSVAAESSPKSAPSAERTVESRARKPKGAPTTSAHPVPMFEREVSP